jgi:hypothetical protein
MVRSKLIGVGTEIPTGGRELIGNVISQVEFRSWSADADSIPTLGQPRPRSSKPMNRRTGEPENR